MIVCVCKRECMRIGIYLCKYLSLFLGLIACECACMIAYVCMSLNVCICESDVCVGECMCMQDMCVCISVCTFVCVCMCTYMCFIVCVYVSLCVHEVFYVIVNV